jgi:hypothetical protein
MKPEIEAYLREHGARYTTEALRSRLVAAGHDPGEVDAALQETEVARAPLLSDRQTFGRLALWLHVGALVVVVVLVVIINGVQALGLALIAAVVLALFLALGWAVSSLIGRALLPHTGLVVALIVPVVSALALGGWCLSIMGTFPGVAN